LRHFNRFYTRRIGSFERDCWTAPVVTEARVLYELARATKRPPTEVRNELDLDAGYLSRILRGPEAGWVRRTPANDTTRRQAALADPVGTRRIEPLTPDPTKRFATS